MKTIYKYNLKVIDYQNKKIPDNAKFLYAGLDNRKELAVWYEVETDEPLITKNFYVYGTGHEIDNNQRYLSTILTHPFVWHIYEDEEGV